MTYERPHNALLGLNSASVTNISEVKVLNANLLKYQNCNSQNTLQYLHFTLFITDIF